MPGRGPRAHIDTTCDNDTRNARMHSYKNQTRFLKTRCMQTFWPSADMICGQPADSATQTGPTHLLHNPNYNL